MIYSKLSHYYDEIMGCAYLDVYKDILIRYIGSLPVQKKILDLGCGTGTFLSQFSKNNITIGLDISEENVTLAKQKDPHSDYYIGDIVDFSLDSGFDIITCCFDTINHLLQKQQWESLFSHVASHLDMDGYFLFDMNTIEKFLFIDKKIITKYLDNGALYTMQTYTNNTACNFIIRFFEQDLQDRSIFHMTEEEIMEISFRYEEIEEILY